MAGGDAVRSCHECIHSTNPVMGKLHCRYYGGEEVEVDFSEDGAPLGFFWAERFNCPAYHKKEATQ